MSSRGSLTKFPIAPVLEHYYGVQVLGGRGWRRMKCPVHPDTNASASVNTETQHWKCHGQCDLYEDAIDVIIREEGCGYAAAVTRAEELTNVERPEVPGARRGRREVPDAKGSGPGQLGLIRPRRRR